MTADASSGWYTLSDAEDRTMIEDHLQAVTRYESRVHALVDWDEGAARKRARAAGDGPLAGWAIGVKDLIDVRGLPTQCGADFLPCEPAVKSAASVDRLEALGAYVFSKVVTTTFGYYDPGPTTNPWNPEHTPGGSSMGSAAAVATGMVRLALGSQTIGSINRPAAFCGVVGLKPTFGRISCDGAFGCSPTVDTLGFFTRNTGDLETACAAYLDETPQVAPRALRAGVIEDLYCSPADADMLGALHDVAARLNAAGFEAQSTRLPESFRDAYSNHNTLIRAEGARVHKAHFTRFGEQYPPKLREFLLEGQQVSDDQLLECRARREELELELETLLADFDVLVTPSAPGAAPRDLTATGDPRMNLIFTHTRVPSLTLPVAVNARGLPLGIQLGARKHTDFALIAAAREIERVIGFHDSIPA